MNLSTIPKRYLISAIIQRSPKPISSKEGSKHLQVEGVCDVPFPKERKRGKRKREKSEHLQNEGECSQNTREPKECRKIIMREALRISNCQVYQESFFKFVKFYYQYSFINCFHNIKFSFLFISRKLIASLKKVNCKQFGFPISILRSEPCLEVMLWVEKKEYLCNNVQHFQKL